MIDSLAEVVGISNVTDSPSALVSYSVDGTVGYRGFPSVIVFPKSNREVAKLLKLATTEGWTVVGRGGGTSLAAGAVPPTTSIVLSTERLNYGPHILSLIHI